MHAVDWANLGYAGTFVFGVIVGAVATIRLTKVIADVLHDIRRHDAPDEPPAPSTGNPQG